jgi:transforming growth factor-beta-induced protein
MDLVDIEKSNGVIHVIDRTLIPPAPDVVPIAQAFAEIGEFETLVSLLENPAYADILEALQGDGPFTVFAPTDAAFEAIDTGALTEDQIAEVLRYHVTIGRALAEGLVVGQNIPMLNGQNVKVIAISADAIELEDNSGGENAIVVIKNVHGGNGVIHAIDKVLIPNL